MRVIPAVTLLAPGVAFVARRCFFAPFGSDWAGVSAAMANFP
jgi:hypothetical protein